MNSHFGIATVSQSPVPCGAGFSSSTFSGTISPVVKSTETLLMGFSKITLKPWEPRDLKAGTAMRRAVPYSALMVWSAPETSGNGYYL